MKLNKTRQSAKTSKMIEDVKTIGAPEMEQAGFTLVPLRPGTKAPAVSDWTSTKKGQFPAKNIKGNYGVVLQKGDLVIDVDPRAFPPGDRPLKRLREYLGQASKVLAETFVVRSGGGGLHIYLKKPEDTFIVHGLKEYPGVEFSTAGRQVVGPGCTHPKTGKKYEVVQGTPWNIKPAPPALLDILRKKDPASSALIGEGFSAPGGLVAWAEDEVTQQRYIEYLSDVAPISIEGQNGDNTAFKVAAFGRDLGLPPVLAFELMLEYWNKKCLPPWSPEELEQKVANAYRYSKEPKGNAHPASGFDKIEKPEDDDEKVAWQLTKSGQVVKCFYNLLNYMRLPEGGLKGLFTYNEFTGMVEFSRPAPWHRGKRPNPPTLTDSDLKILKGYLAEKFSFEAAVTTIEEAITVIAHQPKYRIHPIREYLSSLRWDGKPRIEGWLSQYAGADETDFTKAVGRKLLLAAVSRIFHPGCQYDHVVILEGKQGIGKSALCRILGGQWASDFTLDPHSKDTVSALQGKWIVEIAEMAVFKKADMEALKAFITRPTDRARLAYGRVTQEFPRQCVFIGTINPEADGGYLTDMTGNRRFWPVHIRQVDFVKLSRDRDQLWAETVHMFKHGGEDLYMSDDNLRKMAVVETAKREVTPVWAEAISEWLSQPEVYNGPDGKPATRERRYCSTREIYRFALGGADTRMDRRAQLNIAAAMRYLGWDMEVKRVDGEVKRIWIKQTKAETKSEEKSVLDEL